MLLIHPVIPPRTSILPLCRYLSTSQSLLKSSNSASSNRWLNRQNNDFYTRRAKAENLKSRAAFKLLQIEEKFHIFKKSKTSKPVNVLDLGAAPGAWNQVALDRCPKGSKVLGVDILPYSPPSGASALQGNILSKGTHKLIKDFFRLSELQRRKKVFDDVEVKTSKKGSDQSDFEVESDFSIIEKEMELTSLADEILDEKIESDDISLKYPVDVVLSDMYVPFPRDDIRSNCSTTNSPYLRMANTTGLTVRDHAMSMDLCDAALVTAVDLLRKNGSFVIKFFTGEEDKLLEMRLNKVFKDVKRFKPKACRVESKECYFVCLNKREYEVDKVALFSAFE